MDQGSKETGGHSSPHVPRALIPHTAFRLNQSGALFGSGIGITGMCVGDLIGHNTTGRENFRNIRRPYPTLKTVGHWHGSIVDVERVGDEHDHVRQLIENSLVGLMVMARPARIK
jgi:hypothetical protein